MGWFKSIVVAAVGLTVLGSTALAGTDLRSARDMWTAAQPADARSESGMHSKLDNVLATLVARNGTARSFTTVVRGLSDDEMSRTIRSLVNGRGEVAVWVLRRERGAVSPAGSAAAPGDDELDGGSGDNPRDIRDAQMAWGETRAMVVDPGELDRLVADPDVLWVGAPPTATPLGQPIVGGGVGRIGADVWHAANITGRGVKLAILDVGFIGWKQRIASGELPDNVITRDFSGKGLEGDEVHGTACAEIAHEIAPDAQLYLVHDGGGPESIDWLIAQKVDVISFSAGYSLGPSDGKSYIDKWFRRAVDAGITVIASAGNEANNHWSGVPVGQDAKSGILELAPGVGGLEVDLTSGGAVLVSWDDWKHGDTQSSSRTGVDYDVYLFTRDGQPAADLGACTKQWSPGCPSTNPQVNGAPPIEAVQAPAAGNYVVIVRTRIPNMALREVHVYGRGLRSVTPLRKDNSICWPADTDGVLAVGAWEIDHEKLASYSSRGPTSDGRNKPELVAPTNVATASYGDELFNGTSSSAPHVAGAAALLIQKMGRGAQGSIAAELRRRVKPVPGAKDEVGAGLLFLGSPGESEPAPPSRPGGSWQAIIGPIGDWLSAIIDGCGDGSCKAASAKWGLQWNLASDLASGVASKARVSATRDAFVTIYAVSDGEMLTVVANRRITAGETIEIPIDPLREGVKLVLVGAERSSARAAWKEDVAVLTSRVTAVESQRQPEVNDDELR